MPVTVEEVNYAVTVEEVAYAVTVDEVSYAVTVATPGPAGATGPAGAAGAAGATGATGATGPAGSGFTNCGPWTVAQGANDLLTGEDPDPLVNDMVDYWFKIKRSTTAFVRKEFSIIYRNGAWERADGPQRYADAANEAEVEFTVNATTGEVSAENLGTGSVVIYGQKNAWAT